MSWKSSETYVRSMLGTSGASLPKWPHLESGNEAPPNKSVGCTVSTSSSESRRKGQLTYHPPCFVTSGTLMSKQLQFIILLFRRKLMSFWLREQ